MDNAYTQKSSFLTVFALRKTHSLRKNGKECVKGRKKSWMGVACGFFCVEDSFLFIEMLFVKNDIS